MHKDFKMGMLLGLVPILVGIVWLTTRPGLSTQMLHGRTHRNEPELREQSRQDAQPVDSRRTGAEPAAPVLQEDAVEVPEQHTERTEQLPKPKYHVVEKNENLSEIARKHYGSSAGWRSIYRANRSIIPDPDRVKPGTRLLIP